MKSSITKDWFSEHLAEDIAFEKEHPFVLSGRGQTSSPRVPFSTSGVLIVAAKISGLSDYTTLRAGARFTSSGIPRPITTTASTHAA